MISRTLNLLKLLDKNSSILLLGPRGTGKTVLLQDLLATQSRYISIDLLQGPAYQRYVTNPHMLHNEVTAELEAIGSLLVVAIDEVQRVPALLNEVHALIEQYKGKVAFILSGSSARKLRRGGANLLAGRAISRFLHPLHSSELSLDLGKALHRGTLPGVYLEDDEIALLRLETYVSTYLREEIQQEALVRAVDTFGRFLEFAGQVNGEPINFSKLGRQIGIAGKTVQEYFNILSDTLLGTTIYGWSHSLKKQLLLAPKFYFFDTGVLNAINGYLRIELRPSSFLYGRLFETFIIAQLAATNHYHDLGLKFFSWREKGGGEVDLLLARNVGQRLPNASERVCVCTTPLVCFVLMALYLCRGSSS